MTTTLLKVLGFDGARVEIGSDGRNVGVVFSAKQACTASPKDETRISERVRESLFFVRSVTVTVEGSGRTLARYIASSCKRKAIPKGKGKVVFERSGHGFEKSKSFRIRGKTWTIEFENNGKVLQVFLYKDGQLSSAPIQSNRREVGKKTLRGPGTFRFDISGSGDWTIRARDAGS